MVNRVGSWLLAWRWRCVARRHRRSGSDRTLSGTVVDASGSVPPGANVNVKNASTQVSREVVTDANGAFVDHRSARRHVRRELSLTGFKTHVQTRRRPVGERARGAARDRARSRPARRDHLGDRRSGAHPDAERRALGPDHPGTAEGNHAQGPRLHGHAAADARRRRHAEPRGARLEQPRRPQHQRRPQQHHQPDLRRRHQPRHRIEHRPVPRARASIRSPRSRC